MRSTTFVEPEGSWGQVWPESGPKPNSKYRFYFQYIIYPSQSKLRPRLRICSLTRGPTAPGLYHPDPSPRGLIDTLGFWLWLPLATNPGVVWEGLAIFTGASARLVCLVIGILVGAVCKFTLEVHVTCEALVLKSRKSSRIRLACHHCDSQRDALSPLLRCLLLQSSETGSADNI